MNDSRKAMYCQKPESDEMGLNGKTEVCSWKRMVLQGKEHERCAHAYAALGALMGRVEVIRWCRKEAAGGNADAGLLLGLMERYGSGDVKDSREAEELLTKAAGQGSAVAEAALGEMFDSREDYAKAAEWYRKAAEHGIPAAETCMGDLCLEGHGVSQDYAEALRWYQKAADQGDAIAANNLGTLYLDGLGTEQDYGRAMKWFKKAAGQNEPAAMINLGNMYYEGRGVRQDAGRAFRFYRKAADLGDAGAQSTVGDMLVQGTASRRITTRLPRGTGSLRIRALPQPSTT